MARNFYTILGLKETASPEEIQEAFRRLARAYHPDVSGADSTPKFLEIQEAWDTLGDAERRRQYDARLGRERRPVRVGPRGRPWSERDRNPVRAEAGTDLHLEVQVSPSEAARGGEVPADLPAVTVCPQCRGRGQEFLFLCPACGGRGYGLHSRRLILSIPPGLATGEVLQVPLRG